MSKRDNVTTEDNKVFIVDVQKANEGAFFKNNKSFFKAEVIIKGFKDKADTPNEMVELKINSTFTADTTAASLAKATALEDGKIILEFNKEVTEGTINALTIKTIDGIVQSSGNVEVKSAVHPIVNGEKIKN